FGLVEPISDLRFHSSQFAVFVLEGPGTLRHIELCQGPWNVDLRTPPGPEGSNGSLLCVCRGHPGFYKPDELSGYCSQIPSTTLWRCGRTGARHPDTVPRHRAEAHCPRLYFLRTARY